MAARRTTKKTDASADIAPDAPASDAPASERTTTSDPSARTSSGASREDIQLLLARSLFRADKWDPARDANAPFEWDPQRVQNPSWSHLAYVQIYSCPSIRSNSLQIE